MENKITTQWSGIEYDLDKLKKENGTVEHDSKILYLLQNAYVENYGTDGEFRYCASAIDKEGYEYTITWETVEEWEDHVCGEDGYCVVEGCNSSWCSDESNACDWDIFTVTEN